jgi:hypothetical protein
MAYNTVPIKKDVDGKPIPQFYNPIAGQYEALEGLNGASKSILYDADGNPVDLTKLVQKANMEYYGKSTDTKPVVDVIVGSTYFEIDTKRVYMWDGTSWVVI